MLKRLSTAGALLVAAIALPVLSAAPAWAQAEDTIAAQRGDLKVTVGELNGLLALMPADARAKILESPASIANFARDRMIARMLIGEAKASKFDAKPDVQARMAEARDTALINAFLASVTQADPSWPSEAEIDSVYEANKTRVILPKQYHILDIALFVPTGATKEQEDAIMKQARDIKTQVSASKADFLEIAKKVSQAPTLAQNGGDLGFLREDALQTGIRETVMAMKDGTVSDPLRTPDSYHVLKLVGTKPPGPAPLADVKATLVAAMRQQRTQQLTRGYIDGLIAKQAMTVNEADLAKMAKKP